MMRPVRVICTVVFLSVSVCCSVFGVAWRRTNEMGRLTPHEPSPVFASPVFSQEIEMTGSPRSGPAVGKNGTIYVEAVSGEVDQTLFLNAVNPAGQVKWRFALPSRTYPRRPPALGSDGTIYVTGSDGFVRAVSQTGQLKREFQFTTASNPMYDDNPVIGPDGTLYLSTENLCAYTPMGVLKWRTDSRSEMAAGVLGDFNPSVTVGKDGTVYAVNEHHTTLMAFTPGGKLKWHFRPPVGPFGGVDGDPALGLNNVVYVCGIDGILYALDADGKTLWTFPLENYGKPLHLYPDLDQPTCGPDGTIYLGVNQNFYAILPSGKLKWKVSSLETDHYRPLITKTGIVYVAGKRGAIFAFDADGHVKWRRKLTDDGEHSFVIPFLALTNNWSVCAEVRNDGELKNKPYLFVLQ